MANYIPEFTLADRLRKAREVTGLTIKEFATASGISDTSVTNYEHGYRSPRRIYLEKWAEVSGVDVVWLLTGEAPAFAGASEGLVRPKGLEPPTFCSVVGRLLLRQALCLVYFERQVTPDSEMRALAGVA